MKIKSSKLKGWESGLGGIGIELGSSKTPPMIGIIGSKHMRTAIDDAIRLTKMWNDEIDAAGGDLSKTSIHKSILAGMLARLVDGHVVPQTMVLDTTLTAGYVADNAVSVGPPPDYKMPWKANGACFTVALKLTRERQYDVVVGAAQRNFGDAKFGGSNPHVWNQTADGTMCDGGLGGRGYQHAVLALIPSHVALKLSEEDLATMTWSYAFGLSDQLIAWAETELENLHEVKFEATKKSISETLLKTLIKEVLNG